MNEEGSPRALAMTEFVGTFASLSGNQPESLADLSDGVTLFEALSEIAPMYFDPTTIARHLGDNWALKASNLRKLIRNLEDFYHEVLYKTTDFESIPLTAIAREGDADGIARLVELVAAAAVTCNDKGTFVQRILGMSENNQAEMKAILEQTMGELSDYNDDDDEGEENELVFDNDEEEDRADAGDTQVQGGMFGGAHVNDGMEEELAEARREISQLKSQAASANQDNERAQAKLRAVVEDLQDRMMKRQDDMIQLEEDLRTTTTELEDTKAKLVDKENENAQLADDLDVASAKAQQLHKAEATVMAYKKRLEGMGSMNQHMSELEDQASDYVRQIMDLEAQVKKSEALQKIVNQQEEQIKAMEKERESSVTTTQNASSEIAELKSSLMASERAKKQYEEELVELRAKAEVADTEAQPETPVASLAASTGTAQDREKLTRLKVQNEQLQLQVEELKAQQKTAAAAAATAAASAASVSTAAATAKSSSDNEEVVRLKGELETRNKEIAKISSDKDKLETYTKRTLAKFQEKYLVALQECKAKLKEKQDKIESLESRSASERTAQKREERLLSSTIYELGLAIMQNRLKER